MDAEERGEGAGPGPLPVKSGEGELRVLERVVQAGARRMCAASHALRARYRHAARSPTPQITTIACASMGIGTHKLHESVRYRWALPPLRRGSDAVIAALVDGHVPRAVMRAFIQAAVAATPPKL